MVPRETWLVKSASPNAPTLLDRQQCLADLDRWVFTTAGGGCIALVHGEAGIGKTALIRDFTQRQSGRRVLWGACDDLFTPQPLAPLRDIARQAKGTLLDTITSGASRDVIFNAVLDDLERGKPATVVFEDMHWADEATLDLLKFLGRRIASTRAMLVLTYRDEDTGPRHPLRSVIGDLPREHTRRMALTPLSGQSVAKLARQAGHPPANLHALTGGNPLLVTELLASGTAEVPMSIRDAVLARTIRLSAAAGEIAEFACVFPGKTAARLLEQVVELDESAIESGRSIGLTRDEDGAFSFRHELVRRALESSLSETRRHNLHIRLLTILKSDPTAPAARLVHHADGCSNVGAVLHYAPIAAAHAASIGAHREAAAHYRTALRYVSPLEPGRRAALQDELAYELYLIGEITQAVDMRASALTAWRAMGNRLREGDCLRWLSTLVLEDGRRAEAIDYATQAMTILESLPPGFELEMARRVHDQLHAHGRETQESLQIARAEGFPDRIARAYLNLLSGAVLQRQWDLAQRYQQEGDTFCASEELVAWRLEILARGTWLKFDRGDWASCSDDIDVVLRASNVPPAARICALTALAQIRTRRGDPDSSSPLEEAQTLAVSLQDLHGLSALAIARAEAAWLLDDRAGVVSAVLPIYERTRQRCEPRMNGELGVWLFRAGALRARAEALDEPYACEIAGNWQGAVEAWKQLGCPYEHATVLALYGGEAQKREALAIFERLDAAPASRAIRRQFRADGIKRIPRGARTTTQSNPFGLTRREAEVLDLLSKGMRNSAIARALFVSQKTVDHHVSSILGKLGVPSRGAAVVATRVTGPQSRAK
jgi:DNA-binding CsgD family transcriptional regulator